MPLGRAAYSFPNLDSLCFSLGLWSGLAHLLARTVMMHVHQPEHSQYRVVRGAPPNPRQSGS